MILIFTRYLRDFAHSIFLKRRTFFWVRSAMESADLRVEQYEQLCNLSGPGFWHRGTDRNDDEIGVDQQTGRWGSDDERTRRAHCRWRNGLFEGRMACPEHLCRYNGCAACVFGHGARSEWPSDPLTLADSCGIHRRCRVF